ncbi:pyruvate dehydrogenase complex E1 alpha subunit, IAR4-LIKE [Hibiscus trionum]|uniref:Pyruvate dehydrogenase complex E1 alpha subunit, IAR4-LIKE n=1 Tax=Hibiscus trionum TaxID=183268 RepID=A0A9W7MEP2_HIBTR|nr:pyruvate dehydrogenase complex E1 alpha subunit, IAR4-LIKE [Hibiscus trionum]
MIKSKDGKVGSLHFYKKDSSGHGIVGAQVPLGCALALAQKYSRDKSVTFALYGDEAANQVKLFEALDIYSHWKLPAILVCENNQYGKAIVEWRAEQSSSRCYRLGDFVPGVKVRISWFVEIR